MSKFVKVAIVGGAYALIVIALLPMAIRQASSVRPSASSGIFTMFGMAILGLSIVAAVIVFAISKEPRD